MGEDGGILLIIKRLYRALAMHPLVYGAASATVLFLTIVSHVMTGRSILSWLVENLQRFLNGLADLSNYRFGNLIFAVTFLVIWALIAYKAGKQDEKRAVERGAATDAALRAANASTTSLIDDRLSKNDHRFTSMAKYLFYWEVLRRSQAEQSRIENAFGALDKWLDNYRLQDQGNDPDRPIPDPRSQLANICGGFGESEGVAILGSIPDLNNQHAILAHVPRRMHEIETEAVRRQYQKCHYTLQKCLDFEKSVQAKCKAGTATHPITSDF
ncbi:hypothetical protein NKH61_05090 [Mesorhizobium sp. M1005]|uniref:hypothetical protein n=1 Tax=unclassified Mesorhizobium TaxID=325217 RepID=UPI00333AD1E2